MAETEVIMEIVEIFGELSPESQQNLLMYIRVAHMAENSMRKTIKKAISNGKDKSDTDI